MGFRGTSSRRQAAVLALLLFTSLVAACGGSGSTVQTARDGSPEDSGRAGAGATAHGGSSAGGGSGAGGLGGSALGEGGGSGPGGSGSGGSGGSPDAGGPTYSCAGTGPRDAGQPDAGGSGDDYGTLGHACSSLGALACAGPNQLQTLICNAGTWQALTTCTASQRCDPSSGVCADVVPVCSGHSPGYAVCQQNTLTTCGPSLVTTTSVACCGVCQAGACVAPRCGDGKVEGTEACDDGNSIPGDGCEPDCQPTEVLQLTAGRAHTCALLTGGQVRCWGANDQGQLGLGTNADRSAVQPYQNGIVSLGGPAAFIAAGADHTCALMTDGSLRCWGANGHGQLGLGNSAALGDDELPSSIPPINFGLDVTAVAAGGDCTCAIFTDGTLRCWGDNTYGQLGLGSTDDVGDDEIPSQAAAQVALGGTAALVTTGGYFTCAVLSDGHHARCWGQNARDELGLGTTTNIGDTELPTAVAPVAFPMSGSDPSMYDLISIVAGELRTCALMQDGDNYCWGDNDDGGLGVEGVGTDVTKTATGSGVFSWSAPGRRMAAGGFHVCIELADSELRCWGENTKGQLGLSNTDTLGDNESVLGVPAIDLGDGADGFSSYAAFVTAGVYHTCVILGDGRVLCWGANESGQLGLGYASSPPVDYVGGTSDSVPAKLNSVSVFPPVIDQAALTD